MKKRGVKIVLGAQHAAIEKTATGYLNRMTSGGDIETDLVMFATGRRPYVEGLGLEAAGVRLNESGAIAVDRLAVGVEPTVAVMAAASAPR